MLEIIKTDSSHKDFIHLVALLDAELAIRDGDENAFYAQYNKIDKIKYALIAYYEGKAIGCGAFKEYNKHTVEVKRMFVTSDGRRKGIASKVLKALEAWAVELNYNRSILETGKRQPEAIALYKYSGYEIIPNFDQYIGMENSVCFEKILE